MKPNFWNCFEIYCISADFSYDSYCEIHKRTSQHHALLNELSYSLLKDIFWNEFCHDQNVT